MPETAQELLGGGAGTWKVDGGGSSVRFRHATMWGLVKVKGTFGAVSGAGQIGADGTAEGRIEIDAASVDTKNKTRDNHLRGEDFFAVETHPAIVFSASAVTPGGGADATVSGQLEVAGQTKDVTVPVQVTEATDNSVTVEAHLDVDRADFGLTWNKAGMIKGPATLDITTRFVREG